MENVDIDSLINKALTCATDVHCSREETCFHVAMWAKEVRSRQRIHEAIDRSDPGPDLDEISNYAPGWEMS